MEIIEIDGLKMILNSDGRFLLIESDRLQEYLEYAAKKKIKQISLQAFHGFKLRSTNFFEQYDFFTHVWIVNDLAEIDISGIRFLKHLMMLRMNNNKQGLDFSNFPELRHAAVEWNDRLINLNACKKLSHLEIWKYNPKSESLLEISDFIGLVCLEVTQSNIISLLGIENLVNLKEFRGNYLKNLENIDQIISIKEKLTELSFDSCKKLNDYTLILGKMTGLHKLVITSCGDLENVDFINKIPGLTFFSFYHTNVKNGDLSPLSKKRIEFVSFDDKKHYSHKMKQINPSFSWKAQ